MSTISGDRRRRAGLQARRRQTQPILDKRGGSLSMEDSEISSHGA